MFRFKPPLRWLVVLGFLGACNPQEQLRTGVVAATDGAATTSVEASTPAAGATPSGGSPLGGTTPGTPIPIVITNLPSPAPVASPTPPPTITRVAISTDSLTLNTPRDRQAPGASQDAGFPISHQLIGLVYWSDGNYTSDVVWHSSNPSLLTVDASGVVQTTMPRGTGQVTVTAAAKANMGASASALVTVVDLGKVQADVF